MGDVITWPIVVLILGVLFIALGVWSRWMELRARPEYVTREELQQAHLALQGPRADVGDVNRRVDAIEERMRLIDARTTPRLPPGLGVRAGI